jgi:hypothetical protein
MKILATVCSAAGHKKNNLCMCCSARYLLRFGGEVEWLSGASGFGPLNTQSYG